MSTRSQLMVALALPLLASAASETTETPNLGQTLSADQVENINFTVMPDGEGLPAGSGSAAAGEVVYREHCLACHGGNGEGGPNDRLVGGRGSIDGPQPVKTIGSYWPQATTLFDYIRRAMPYTAPGSLNNDDIYAVTAYLLHLNGIVDLRQTMNAQTLPAVKMPNRENFYWAWKP